MDNTKPDLRTIPAPLLALCRVLPPAGTPIPFQQRLAFVVAFRAAVAQSYPDPDGPR